MCQRPPLRDSCCLLGVREGLAEGANLGTGRDKIKARVRAFIASVFLSRPYHRPFLAKPSLRLPVWTAAHPASPPPAFPESLSEYGPFYRAVLFPWRASSVRCSANFRKPHLFAQSGLPAYRAMERNPRARACFSALPTAYCPLAFHATSCAGPRSSAPARPPARSGSRTKRETE